MKNLILTTLLSVALFASTHVQAQEFQPLRVDAGVGYSIPFPKGYDGGIMFYLEPKYEIAPQIAAGIRWEGAFFGGGGEGISMKMGSSYMATGDYYVNNNKFRPFVGLGLGAHSAGGATLKVNTGLGEIDTKIDGSTDFAAMLRAGFDYSHFRFTVAYEQAFAKETFNYLTLSVGFYIGGGKK